MSDFNEQALIRHIHGATVVHESPFSSIEVPAISGAITLDECKKWIGPFYGGSFRSVNLEFMNSLRGVYHEITPSIVELLLAEYDWRPRKVGAFFAALKRLSSFEDHIGRLLLRSDVCYAGRLYCVALAEFNSPTGLDYLKRYLEYYLTRPDLHYNQGDAMGAIDYLDRINGTTHFKRFQPLWETYANAIEWVPELEDAVRLFFMEIEGVHQCRSQVEKAHSVSGLAFHFSPRERQFTHTLTTQSDRDWPLCRLGMCRR